MSGIGSSGDTLAALLNLVADPSTHKKRLDELRAAEASSVAAANKLTSTRAQITQDQEALDATVKAHRQTVADFKTERESILTKAASFDARETAVAAKEKSASIAQSALETAQKLFEDKSNFQQAALDKREAETLATEAAQSALAKQLSEMKTDLETKLSAIRKLAQ